MNALGNMQHNEVANKELLSKLLNVRDYNLHPFDWAAENLDYSLCTAYESQLKTRFNPLYMPYMREPAGAIINPRVKECWILKCSRAGATENSILLALRFIVACQQMPSIYVGGDQKFTEFFFDTRIKRGFQLSQVTAEKYAAARSTEHAINFESMDLTIAWPSSRMAFKGSGYAFIGLDEVSTYKDASIIDVIRKRTANWRHATIFGISSPATEIDRPSTEDPIFIEYNSGTQKKWMMRDENGELFSYEMSGIKWDQSAKLADGSWDYNRVYETAHYETPSGAIITESERMKHVRQEGAFWLATNNNAVAGRESYYINAPMTPFESGEFGHIAVKFLLAKASGNKRKMRAFFYEYMPEPINDDQEKAVSEQQIIDLQKANIYARGKNPLSKSVNIITIDTQDRYFVWSVWALSDTQHALIDHGYETDLNKFNAMRETFRLQYGCIDTGGHRTDEVYRYCARNRWMFPVKGDNYTTTSFKKPISQSDVYGLKLMRIHPSYFKDIMHECLNRRGIVQLMFHNQIPTDQDYLKQITGEALRQTEDKRGNIRFEWVKIATHNDFFDCMAYSFAMRFVLHNKLQSLGASASFDIDDDIEKKIENKRNFVVYPD